MQQRYPKSYKRVGIIIQTYAMETFKTNWQEFYQEQLNEQEMLRIRGGDDPGDSNPDDPIVTGC